MAEREQVHRESRRDARPAVEGETTGTTAPSGTPTAVERGKRIKEDIDKLADEIDEVLESNAFKGEYVQKGG